MLNFYKFYNKTGLDNEHYGPLISKIMNLKYTIDLKPMEHLIKKKPWCSYNYAEYAIKGRWPEGEPIIMKEPQYAYYYAKDIIKGKWIEAESVIATNPLYAYWYAIDVIKGRFIEAEPYIELDKAWWFVYCKEFNI